eukprot:1159078-Rhodomonas_salina.1
MNYTLATCWTSPINALGRQRLVPPYPGICASTNSNTQLWYHLLCQYRTPHTGRVASTISTVTTRYVSTAHRKPE